LRSGLTSFVSSRLARLNFAAGTARSARPASPKSNRRRQSAIQLLGRRSPPPSAPLVPENSKSRDSVPPPSSKKAFQL
jgi:hypothetical protein